MKGLARLIPLAAMSALAVALVACQSSPAPTQQPAAPAPAQPGAAATPRPTATPVQPQQPAPAAPAPTPGYAVQPPQLPQSPLPTPVRRTLPADDTPVSGGTLRIVSVGSVQSFDPLWTTASGTANVSGAILEGLLDFTSDYGIAPLLLESWQQSPNGLQWTFKIRGGVKFHDGTPLTTEQVIGTLNRQKNKAPVLRLVMNQFGRTDAQGQPSFEEFVRRVDELTFTLNLKEPTLLALNAIGPQNFTPRIVTEPWYTVSADESAPGEPIGTGPFRFEQWIPGDRWSAVRYTGYSPHPNPANGFAGGHRAYVDRVVYIEVPDQTSRVAALQVGQVDMAQEFPAELLARLDADPNINLYDLPPSRLLGHFNHTRAPFNIREARQALVKAYDNEKALLLATGDPNFIRLCPSLMQCGTLWESSAGADGFYNARDVEGARALVRQAGVEGMTVRLMDPTDRQPAHAAAQVSREVLAEIGFNVDFLVMDWATMVSRRARPDDWEFFHTWSGVTVRSGPVGHLAFGELQYNAWFNKYQDVDGKQRALFEQLARATTQEDQMRIMDEFQQYFYEDAIFLQVGEFFQRWAARTRVRGIVPGAGDQAPMNKWLAQ